MQNKNVLCLGLGTYIHKLEEIVFAVLMCLGCAICSRPVTSACLYQLEGIRLI